MKVWWKIEKSFGIRKIIYYVEQSSTIFVAVVIKINNNKKRIKPERIYKIRKPIFIPYPQCPPNEFKELPYFQVEDEDIKIRI